MLEAQCSWCQKSVEIDKNLPFHDIPGAQCICTDCLIPILPKSLVSGSDLEASDPTDQRSSQRLPVISQIHLSQGKKRALLTHALILNLSDSGMKLQLDTSIDKGIEVILGFLGSKVAYKAIGLVVRCQLLRQREEPYYELGIRLTGIHQDLRAS